MSPSQESRSRTSSSSPRARQDEVARLPAHPRGAACPPPGPGPAAPSARARNASSSPAFTRRLKLVVQLVELGGQRVDHQLALAEDPDDHAAPPSCSTSAPRRPRRCWRRSPAASGAGPRSRAAPRRRRARASSAPAPGPRRGPPPSWSSSRWMSSFGCAVGSSRAPEAISSSTAAARACSCAVLSWARWIGHADVAHLLGDAGEGLADPGLRLGRGVGGLDGLLLRAEGLHLGLQPLRLRGQVLLLALQRLYCVSQVADLRLERPPCGSAPRGPGPRGRAPAPCRAWPSSLSPCCCSCFICSSTRLREVATSATPRRTFCSSSSCFWYE